MKKNTARSDKIRNRIDITTGLIFLIAITTAWIFRLIPTYIYAIYPFAGFITFILYKRDKYCATENQWRVSEMTLHFWEIAGGWPIALIIRRILRHKTRKLSYRIVFALCIIINLIILAFATIPYDMQKRFFTHLFIEQ